MLKKTSSFFEKIFFSDKSDIFPKKCVKLYISKAKGEKLELEYGPLYMTKGSTGVLSWCHIRELILVLVHLVINDSQASSGISYINGSYIK